MIDCHIVSCRAESRQVDGSYCINGSVFSEALDASVTKLMFFASLRWSLFGSYCNQPIMLSFLKVVKFLRVANIFVVSLILLIDND
jgi:hypothetical protein